MSVKYQKVWDTMNALESVTSKICSVREILECAIEAHENHKHEKVEHLLYAVDEFLQYYLQEFDDKFKNAWQATVSDLREGDTKSTLECDRNDPSPECQDAWNDFWGENYYPEEYSKAKVEANSPFNDGWTKEHYQKIVDKYEGKQPKKWVLPVEETKDADTDEIEYFVSFPDDLLEAANLKEGDQVEWVDRGDGSYLIKKVEKKTLSYQEAVDAGWEMTGDGIWIPPQDC